MKLDRKEGHFTMPETCHGVIIQMDMGHFTSSLFKTRLIDAKTVILAGDLDSIADQVGYGLVGTPVPEGQLPGLGPKRQGE